MPSASFLETASHRVVIESNSSGWYGQGWNGPKSLLFQLSIDGSIVAQSSTLWKGAQGPIIYDSIYNGNS